jgi:hypothetical protein
MVSREKPRHKVLACILTAADTTVTAAGPCVVALLLLQWSKVSLQRNGEALEATGELRGGELQQLWGVDQGEAITTNAAAALVVGIKASRRSCAVRVHPACDPLHSSGCHRHPTVIAALATDQVFPSLVLKHSKVLRPAGGPARIGAIVFSIVVSVRARFDQSTFKEKSGDQNALIDVQKIRVVQ